MNSAEKINELIDRYLMGHMDEEEKISFEERIRNDKGLGSMVEEQRLVMEGLRKAWLKTLIKKAAGKHSFWKNTWKWGGAGMVIAMATAGFLWLTQPDPTSLYLNDPYYLPETNEKGEKLWSDADKYLPAQVFSIDPSKDTVIETKGGIVLAIPAGCFKDRDGNTHTGPVTLVTKEALDPEDIMKGGMDTRSGEKLLESGGMFFLDAMSGDERLSIDPGKGIYAEVPASEIKPDMMLFRGERTNDGKINWTEPVRLRKKLSTVDIFSLDFYPPGYLEKVAVLGYEPKDKKFTDSLYYSYARHFLQTEKSKVLKPEPAIEEIKYGVNQMFTDTTNPRRGYQENYMPDSISFFPSESDVIIKGINPAKIRSIWNEKFQKTIIATKEFEERLKAIFGACEEGALDIYVNNLGLSMSRLDSMAAEYYFSKGLDETAAVFLDFGARNDGGVDLQDSRARELKEYYDRKTQIWTEASKLARDKYNDALQKIRNDYSAMKSEQAMKDLELYSMNLGREIELNMNNAYRQLGYEKAPTVAITAQRYGTEISFTGWYNVDRYVLESTVNRQSMEYTDENGKKAVIRYEEWSIELSNANSMDRTYVYLIPTGLYSFMRVNDENGVFSEKLNMDIHYDAMILAFKGERVFFGEKKDLVPGHETLSLSEMPWEKIEKKLGQLAKGQTLEDLVKEKSYIEKEMLYYAEERNAAGREVLHSEMMKFLFCHCGNYAFLCYLDTPPVPNK